MRTILRFVTPQSGENKSFERKTPLRGASALGRLIGALRALSGDLRVPAQLAIMQTWCTEREEMIKVGFARVGVTVVNWKA